MPTRRCRHDGLEASARLGCGLRRPILVIDPHSGHSHAIFPLRTPVITSPGAHLGPPILLDLAGQLLAATLSGTLLPQRALAKNPFGRAENLIGQRRLRAPIPAVPAVWDAYEAAETGLMWHTEPGDMHAYELREIVAALVDDYGEAIVRRGVRRAVHKNRPDPSSLGRNCFLFDAVRFWSYDRAERDGGAILDEAQRVNADFEVPLPANEVAATAASIARFMNGRFRPRTGADGRRGRDRDAGVDLDRRGRLDVSGRVSAASRADATDAALQAACTRIRAAGRPLTQAALAAEAGRSLSTVKRRWHNLKVVSNNLEYGVRRCVSGSEPSAASSATAGTAIRSMLPLPGEDETGCQPAGDQSRPFRTSVASRLPAGSGLRSSPSGRLRYSQAAQSSGGRTTTCRSW